MNKILNSFCPTLVSPASQLSHVKVSATTSDILNPEEREKKVTEFFNRLHESPAMMKIWLRKMPKGGDLHIHMLGSLYSEAILELAIKHHLYFNPNTNLFSNKSDSGFVAAQEIQKDPKLLIHYSNAISMRGIPSVNRQLDHDHFMYECFHPIFSFANYVDTKELILSVQKQAKLQNVQYLELLVGLEALQKISQSFNQLHDHPKIKFIIEIPRILPDDKLFEKQVEEAFKLIDQHPNHVVSINIVGPEDHPIAQTHFEKQMEIIDKIWQKNRKPITLHGGELNQTLSSPDYLKDRIKLTINKGHCLRLGHGVSISEEENALEVLKTMKENNIAVEVCLSSNKKILDVEGKAHPLHLYLKSQVPVVLGSDDAGVTRADFCEQFFIAMYHHHLDYATIKQLARNSLEFSFLPGESIFEKKNAPKFNPMFEGIDAKDWWPTNKATEFLEHSEKAREQVALEREFFLFENEILNKAIL